MSTTHFRPVRGLESIIRNQAVVDGTVYFATDSGKIFVDAQGERNLMGGSGTSILYAEASSIYEHPNGSYIIQTADLSEEGYLPRVDDLIINSDGRFFKVISANDNTIACTLLAVSGTGGGSGGGAGGGGEPGDDRTLDVLWHNVTYSFIAGTPYNITFTATSKVDQYLNVEYRVQTETAVVETKTLQVKSGVKTSIDVGTKMSTSGANAVHFTITGANSHTYTKSFKGIKAIDFKLEQDNDNFTNYEKKGTIFNYYVNAYGLITKTLIAEVDGIQVQSIILSATDNLHQAVEIDCSDFEAGVHTITTYLLTEGIQSNKIITDFIYHPEDAAAATYVLITDYPTNVYSYETPIIKYWVYDTNKSDGDTNNINLWVNNDLIETVEETQYTGQKGELTWPVGTLMIGKNTLKIDSGSGSRSFIINVTESNIFDPITNSALLLLNTEGRTNKTSLERRLQWSYTKGGTTIAAKLKDFNWYNNGWVLDNNNRSCLRISNGASVEIPLKLFTDSQPSVGGCTIEFEFKPYNLYSYDLLTTSASSSGEDEEVEIKREFDSSKATIKYVQGEGASAYGFCLGTQDAYFRLSDGANVTARYRDEEIINIAMTIDAANQQMFIYVNGVMSGMTGYLRSSGELPLYADTLKITSEFCDLDLYNIRIYGERALSSEEIVKNYISSKKDIKIYNENKLSAGKSINLNDLIEYNTANPDNATIPYMIITTKAPDILPYNKSNDDVIVDLEFKNPALDYKFSLNEYSEEEYLHRAPSFVATNVSLNVQGTSSQKYPRKNLKAKFKKSTITCSNDKIENKSMSKIYLDSEIGEKTFTWKADYMDSSGTHNTGFTSFVKLLYKNHPLDYYEGTEGQYQKIYRTTIYGFPMLVFHKKSNGIIEFVGKYNFNLDKGCDDTLGFTHNGVNKILNKPYEDVAECWEFGNNQGGRCSFRGLPFDYGYDYTTKTGKLNLVDDLEVRYHKNADAIEQAFDNLAEDEVTVISDEQAFNILLGGNKAGEHPNGYGHLERLFLWLQEVDFVSETDETLKATKKERFITEFPKHFNMEYSLVYYIMTELLIQYDSRGKNMMLGSWGPMEENGEYIWFPMYYDVDTQLGVDNSGIPSWEYNVEPSNEKHFSTSNSILWTCFHEAFQDSIRSKYIELRGGALKITELNGYYDFDPEVSKSEAMRGILPISLINADQYYKYIAPAVTGYIGEDDNGNIITKYTGGYYYCLQGTRDLHRALFLRNRFNYYDSKWMAGAYNPSTATDSTMRIRITEYLNRGDLNSTTIVNLTPKLDQYVLAWADESKTNLIPKRVEGGKSAQFDLSEVIPLSGYDKQLVYFGGANYIQDLGDMSLLYINELEVPTSSLISIVLGNENPNYENNNISLGQIQDINKKAPQTLLKVYDLTNLHTLNSTIPIDTAEKLETFKALGTNITNAQFANGVALKRLYLPETTNKLELIEAYQLNKIFYNKSDILDENGKQVKEGLYIDNVVHLDTTTNVQVSRLNDIKLIGGALNLYSYDLLKKVTEAKIAMRNYGNIEGYKDTLGIHLERVNWSPYTQLGEGAIYDENNANLFKYAENNFTYSNYEYNAEEWNKLLAEGRIYYYNADLIANTPNDLSLLDKYIEIDDNGHIVHNNYFTNITTTTEKGLPIITGELFINNTEPISEYEIANKYNIAFPSLSIRVANITNAYRARFVKLEDNNIETELYTYRYENVTDNIVPPDEGNILVPSHYDFKGWKLKGSDIIYRTQDDFNTIKFDDGVNTEYTFYLVYEPHVYTISFTDGDNTIYPVEIEYGKNITLPNIIPHKTDDGNLAYNEVYSFKGWTDQEEYKGAVSNIIVDGILVDVTSKIATTDVIYYAVFVKDSVYNNILNVEYFDINRKTQYLDRDANSIYNYINPCAELVLKSQYVTQLKGKITIPTYVPDPLNTSVSIPVVYIDGFSDASQITHCFFDNHQEILLKEFNENCFKGCKLLQYLEIPNSLRYVGSKACYDCDILSMTPGNASNDLIIGGNIYYLGSQSFSGLTAEELTSNIVLGSKIKYISNNAFSYSDRILGAITIGSLEQPTELVNIADGAFSTNGGRQYTNITIYCQDSDHHTQIEDIIDKANIPAIQISYLWSNGQDTDPDTTPDTDNPNKD